MYKRIVSVFLALLMLLSLCACRRKNPSDISESFDETPAPMATEAPQATPAPTTDNSTPSSQPTLNWVESEDGQSMTATLPGNNGENSEVQIGVAEGGTAGDISESDINSAPMPTEAPAPTEAPIPTEVPAVPPAPITVWTGPAMDTTLAEYEAMSGEEQMLFYYSFANAEDFNAWYNAAKAEADANNNYIEIGGDGVVDAEDLLN